MTKADDVPETGKSAKLRAEAERILRRYSDYEGGQAIYGRREVLDLIHIALAAHEPAPVDPLDEIMAALGHEYQFPHLEGWGVLAAEFLRQRLPGIDELARGVTLTNAGTEPEGE